MDDIDKLTNEELDKLLNDETVIQEIKKKTMCPNCKTDDGLIEDYQQGMVVCNKCGLVISNLISENIETKLYEEKDGTFKFMTTNSMFPEASLGTTIGGYNSKLKMIQSWNIMPYKERSLNGIFKEIQSKCEKGGILKCIEHDAKIMYKLICDGQKKNGKKKVITRGINRKSLIASCVFIACRKKGMTRSLTEISELFEIEYIQLTKGCKNFLKFMSNCKNLEIDVGTSKPEHFIKRYCEILKFPTDIIHFALDLQIKLDKLNIASSHTPIAIAMACILFTASTFKIKNITKEFLSKKFDLSEVTINKTFSSIKKYEKILFNDEIVNSYLLKKKNEVIEIPEFLSKKLNLINNLFDENVIELKRIVSCPELSLEKRYDAFNKLYNKK